MSLQTSGQLEGELFEERLWGGEEKLSLERQTAACLGAEWSELCGDDLLQGHQGWLGLSWPARYPSLC